MEVETADGRRIAGRVDEPKGDPGNTLSRAELEAKALGLAEFSGSASPEEMSDWFPLFFDLGAAARAPHFFGRIPHRGINLPRRAASA